MASQDAHDLLGVIEDMIQDRQADFVKRENLERQMEAREDWGHYRYEDAERELLRAGCIKETMNEGKLQVNHYRL